MSEGVDEVRSVKRVPCEVYSRIVGYLRPLQNWNKAKVVEYHERKVYAQPVFEEDLSGSGDLASEED